MLHAEKSELVAAFATVPCAELKIRNEGQKAENYCYF